MKIEQLFLSAYGPFTDQELRFDSAPFVLISGNNETGKSSSLRALTDFFYGIPKSTPDNFIHDYGSLKIGMRLEYTDGETESMYRVKKIKDPLVDFEGEVVNNPRFERILAGFKREQFMDTWGFNHERLKKGVTSFLKDEGELGPTLLSARLGKDIRDLKKKLKDDYSAIYNSRGRTQQLNLAIKVHQKLISELQQAINSRSQYQKLENSVRELEEKKKENESERAQLETQKNSFQKMMAERQTYLEYQDISKLQDTFENARLLDEDFSPRQAELSTDLKNLRKNISDLNQVIESEKDEIRDLKKSRKILENSASELEEMVRLTQNILQSSETIADIAHKEQSLIENARDLVNQSGQSEEELKELVAQIDKHSFKKFNRLIVEWRELRIHLQVSDENIRKVNQETFKSGEQSAAIVKPGDIEELLFHLDAARPRISLEEDFEVLSRRLKKLRIRFHKSCQELLGLDRSPSEVLKLTPPTRNEIDPLLEKMRLTDGQLQAGVEKLEKLEQEAKALVLKHDRNLSAFFSIDDLNLARVERDQALEESISSSNFSSFKIVLKRIDEITDYLLNVIPSEVKWELDHQNLSSMKALRDELKAEIAELNENSRLLESQLTELWKGLVETAPQPNDTYSYLAEFRELVKAALEIEDLTLDQDSMLQKMERIREGMLPFFPEKSKSQTSLRKLITASESLYKSWSTSQSKMEEIGRKLKEDELKLDSYLQEQKKLEEKEDRIVSEIEKILEQNLGDVEPGDLGILLESLEDFKANDESLLSMQKAKSELVNHHSRFTELADSLSDSIPEIPVTRESSILGPYFEILLSNLRNDLIRLQEIERMQKLHKRQLTQKQRELSDVKQQWQVLLQEAGVKDEADLASVVEFSSQARQWRQSMDHLKQQIKSTRLAPTLQQIEELFEKYTDEELRIKTESQERDLAKLGGSFEELIEQRGLLESEMRSMEETVRAAVVEFRIQENKAEIETLKDSYIEKFLAELLLQKIMEAYQSEYKDPILSRAEEYFNRLTLGAYLKYDLDLDDSDRTILRCVSSQGGIVSVDNLSDGTRDQLYLALRLSSVEASLRKQIEPIPFLADDIFVNFDDERTRAGLEALKELSKSCQVILWTHHERLKELAPSGCKVIEL